MLCAVRKGENQYVLFHMTEAVEQTSIYVQGSEVKAVFCNRTPFKVVIQQQFGEIVLFRVSLIEAD